MTSTIEFKGYGKGTVAFGGVYAGYISGSGNYFDFYIPITIPKTASIALSITNLTVYKDSTAYAYDSSNFNLSYLNLTNSGIGIKAEIQFASTQSSNSTSGTVAVTGTLTIS